MTSLSMTRRVGPAVLALALVASALPALALDGNPQGTKQKERHVYKDVQLGLSHPLPHGDSTQTSKPASPAFPWNLPFLAPWAAPVSEGGPGGK